MLSRDEDNYFFVLCIYGEAADSMLAEYPYLQNEIAKALQRDVIAIALV